MTKLRNILVLLCLAVVGTSADEGAARLLLSKQVNSKSYFLHKQFDVLITMSHLDSQQVSGRRHGHRRQVQRVQCRRQCRH